MADGTIQVGDLVTIDDFAGGVMIRSGLTEVAPFQHEGYYLGTYTIGGETAFIFGANPVFADNVALLALFDGNPPASAANDLNALLDNRASATLGTANACFAAGTRIATPFGERAVETLGIGDVVLTADGSARAVRWIGRRGYSRNALALSRDLRPVVVRAGRWRTGCRGGTCGFRGSTGCGWRGRTGTSRWCRRRRW